MPQQITSRGDAQLMLARFAKNKITQNAQAHVHIKCKNPSQALQMQNKLSLSIHL
jgi:CDP-diacylglycerol pyrophosphatase